MQSTAYDLSRFASAPAEKKDPQKKLKVVEGGHRHSHAKAQHRQLRKYLPYVLVFIFMCVVLLVSKATITELNAQVQSTNKSLTKEQSTYNYLTSELNNRTSMANIEDIANRLGLMKVDDSQVTYIVLSDDSVVETEKSELEKITDWFSSGWLSIMDVLDP